MPPLGGTRLKRVHEGCSSPAAVIGSYLRSALSAGHGEAEPRRRRGVHAVEEDHELLLFGDGRPSPLREVVAEGSRAGDLLVGRGVRQEKVAGELPDRELVEGEVRVEGPDDPVPPDPPPGVAVLLEAVAVGERAASSQGGPSARRSAGCRGGRLTSFS